MFWRALVPLSSTRRYIESDSRPPAHPCPEGQSMDAPTGRADLGLYAASPLETGLSPSSAIRIKRSPDDPELEQGVDWEP